MSRAGMCVDVQTCAGRTRGGTLLQAPGEWGAKRAAGVLRACCSLRARARVSTRGPFKRALPAWAPMLLSCRGLGLPCTGCRQGRARDCGSRAAWASALGQRAPGRVRPTAPNARCQPGHPCCSAAAGWACHALAANKAACATVARERHGRARWTDAGRAWGSGAWGVVVGGGRAHGGY
jgi:hypothetical protein